MRNGSDSNASSPRLVYGADDNHSIWAIVPESMGRMPQWTESMQAANHWTSQFQDIVGGVVFGLTSLPVCFIAKCVSDPSPISVFSGGLGSAFSAAGLDT